MIIEFEGRKWDVDFEKIGVDEWRELKRKYQMTPGQWQKVTGEADPDGSTFLYWIMLRQSGNMTVPLGDHLKPDILALNAALSAAQEAEAALQAPPDPEPPVPTSQTGSVVSPAPVSPTTTTPPSSPPGSAPAPGTGSGTATSSSYAPNTSSPSPISATSTSRGLVSSP